MGVVIVSKVPAPYSRNPERLEFEMTSGVTVTGIQKEMGGLKESQIQFRKHQAEVGDALLNVAEGRDKDDPRPAYKHQEFPKMIYHPEKGTVIVKDEIELDEYLRADGWRLEPYLKPQVALEDPKTEKLLLQKQLREKDGEIATLNDNQRAMQRQLDELRELLVSAKPNKK